MQVGTYIIRIDGQHCVPSAFQGMQRYIQHADIIRGFVNHEPRKSSQPMQFPAFVHIPNAEVNRRGTILCAFPCGMLQEIRASLPMID